MHKSKSSAFFTIFNTAMSVRSQHTDNQYWFVTFTCYNWIPLFQITNSYHIVYNWFNYLRETMKAETMAFVIMPNHTHAIIYLHDLNTDLNKLLANGKRFMAYELIKVLEAQHQMQLLKQLEEGVTHADKKKGQKHRAFEPSFDAKAINTLDFFNQKLSYIHANPVKGKWSLAETFTDYEHSSASYYELDVVKHFKPFDYRDVWVF
jgi:putative transposase